MAGKTALLTLLIALFVWAALTRGAKASCPDSASMENRNIPCPSWLQGSWKGTKLNSALEEVEDGYAIEISGYQGTYYWKAINMYYDTELYCSEVASDSTRMEIHLTTAPLDNYFLLSYIERPESGNYGYFHAAIVEHCASNDPLQRT